MMQNYFQLFDLPESFSIDTDKLQQQYRDLLQQYHPDTSDLAEQDAIKQSSQINIAYHALLSPDTRACYLLSLNDQDAQLTHSIGDLTFLAQALELREELDEADDEITLDNLKKDASQWIMALENEFTSEFEQTDWQEACETARKISFMVKLKADIQAAFDRFDDIDDLDAALF